MSASASLSSSLVGPRVVSNDGSLASEAAAGGSPAGGDASIPRGLCTLTLLPISSASSAREFIADLRHAAGRASSSSSSAADPHSAALGERPPLVLRSAPSAFGGGAERFPSPAEIFLGRNSRT
eukprot:CAMPEP_0113558462 /NCGR_PEP_ID=MMETSP0015_2-20120614/18361_1 /TAXON_ID=2838 /ORGANISM="Odontella" /LENGTH=123 /DNA_ID=CAMNT_0000460003 /DNA_START=226 /DNA_END=593 /DNA_ORIENTATION=+ /assembly_acc=CAM_ASM_000160